jgi:gliding motility-associated-like protein
MPVYRNEKLSKMRRRTLKNRFWLLLAAAIFSIGASAQSTADCAGAVIVCGDMAVTLTGGPGLPDFDNPNNDIGDCHLTGEDQSIWLFFRFRTDMPDSSILEFTITPFNGADTDYDFSIFAANTECDSLGSPIRCSYAWTFSNNSFNCGFCPLTGLGNGETDVTEGPFGNGFLAPLAVYPGQGFYLYINEFFDEDDNEGFYITFGGSAADYFDCEGNPNCDLVTVDLGPDRTFCNDGAPLPLTTLVTFATGFETYTWRGANGEEAFIDNPSSPSASILFPDDFAGWVELTLEVSNGDCIHIDTLRLEVLPRLFLHIEGTDTLCLGQNGTLDAGPDFDTYLWSDGSTTSSIEVIQGGIYTVTVTGNDGRCTLTDTMPVVAIPLPAPNLPASASACSGEGITLGPAGTFSAYQWNTGETTSDVTVFEPGLYFLTVTNEYGCEGVGLVAVTFLPAPAPQLQSAYGFCPGDTALISAAPGQGDYLWSTNETSTAISISAPGDYSLTVTGTNGCRSEAAFSVAAYPEPTVQIQGDDDFCSGEQILLEASQGFAAYLWQDGFAGAQRTIDAGGWYSLLATDSTGCIATDSFFVEELPLPTIDLPSNLAFCENALLAIDAGTGYASYLWSDGSTGQGLQVQQPGSYELTVTDANGCPNTHVFNVEELPLPQFSIEGELYFCQDASTSLTAAVIGSYDEISWSSGATGETAAFDTPGTYTLFVLSSNGCSAEQPFVVTEIPPTPVGIAGDSLICAGETGLLDAGLGYASYQWSNGETTNIIQSGLGGLYAVTVTNALGCTGSDTFELRVQPLPIIELQGDSAFFCRDQSLTLDAGPGQSSYLWSTGDTTSSITVSAPGNYSVAVADAIGCSNQAQVEVVEIEPPQPQVEGDLNLCPGDTTTLTISEAYAAYEWSTGATGSSIQISQAGSYQITLTDQYGCQGSANILINELWAPEVEIAGARGFCLGNSASLSAGDHSSYLWSDGSTASAITVAAEGQYSVTVTNFIGCRASASVQVDAWDLPAPNLPEQAELCQGENLTLLANPGYASYEWQNGTTSDTLVINAPGWYYVEAIDSNGCIGRDSVLVMGLPLPQLDVEGIQPICDGTPIILSASGDAGDFLWSTGETTSSILIDRPGNYFVELLDSNGCTGQRSFTIDTLPSLPLTIAGVAGICPGETVMLTGESGFSAYQWNDGTAGPQLVVGDSGLYQLSAIDVNGCRSYASWEVELFPQPAVEILAPEGFCQGSIALLQALGDFPDLLWSTGATGPILETAAPGSYSLIATDINGCRDTAVVMLTEIPLPLAEPGTASPIDCRTENAILGVSSPAPSPNLAFNWSGPGITPSNAQQPTPTVSQPGLYTLVVTDTVSGCVSLAAQVEVEDLRYEPTALVVVENHIDCISATALLNGQGSSSGPVYLYQWYDEQGNIMPSAGSLIFNADLPGTYRLLVIDTVTGCTAEALAAVTSDFAPPTISAGAGGLLTCLTTEWRLSGALSTNGPVAFSWTTAEGHILEGAETLTPLVNQPGWYTLTATNLDNGCQATDSVLMRQDIAAPTAQAGTDQYLDCTTDEAWLDGRQSSQGDRYQYRWTGENGFSLTGTLELAVDEPGAYTLTVTNLENGCSSSDVVIVALIDNFLTGMDADVLPPRCFGEENGLIAINAISGGTAPFLYSLNGAPFSSRSFYPNLPPGPYELLVQDALGCEYAESIFLPEGQNVQLDLGETIEIRLGQSTWLHAITNLAPEEIGSFQWAPSRWLECDTCLLSRAQPLESTLYTATVVDTNGCHATDKVLVIVRKDRGVYIPNAFSPNLDGANDEFMVFGGPDVALVKRFSIYTRWGEPVFEQEDFLPNNPLHGWNGLFRGQPLQAGVYVYYAEVEFIDGLVELFKGDVTLVR